MRKTILALWFALACTQTAAADTFVSADAIAARVSQSIAARLPTQGRYRVTLPDPAYQLTLPAQAKNRYDIAALTFDPARQSFSATLGYTGTSGSVEYVRIVGGALAVLDVPAPARDLSVGETISDSDLTTVEIAADRASGALLTSPESLVGFAARRPLRARAPLFTYDIKKPVLIKKGELVTIHFSISGIELTAQGQAQADAAKGDTVPVLNTHSRRSIEARVTGAGTVSVSTPGMTIAANR